jgi:hypothetical protein
MEGRALGNDEDMVREYAVLVCTQETCAFVPYFEFLRLLCVYVIHIKIQVIPRRGHGVLPLERSIG